MVELLMRRRNAAINQTPPTPVPYDARVDYLEASGTQWIDTLHIPTVGDSLKLVTYAIQSSSSTAQALISAGDGTNQLVLPWIASNRALYFRYFSSSGSSAIGYAGNTWDDIVVDSSGNLTINGVLVASVQAAGDIDGTNKTLRLFYRSNNTAHYFGRIRSFKLMSGNTPVLDLIPVRIGQVGYMYDRVSGQLFGNAGTGDFILGPDV